MKFFYILLIWIVQFLFTTETYAQSKSSVKQIDYILKFYFSGQNKAKTLEQIKAFIDIDYHFTPTKKEKVTFNQWKILQKSFNKMSNLDNSCQLLDFLSGAMYFIDSNQAKKQLVLQPSETFMNFYQSYLKENLLNDFNSDSLQKNAQNAQLNSDLDKFSNQVEKLGEKLKGFALGKKDKPCDAVAYREITIANVNGNSLELKFKNTDFVTLKAYQNYLESEALTSEVKLNYNEKLSTLSFISGQDTEYFYKIFAKKYPKLKLIDLSETSLTLSE
ncbi:MAG: hypothetical protein MUE53_03345 [Chitinophagales bacterium]|jgi:hypothetical protein|nr:hypothetical protein [Chitinophagales bacterium]